MTTPCKDLARTDEDKDELIARLRAEIAEVKAELMRVNSKLSRVLDPTGWGRPGDKNNDDGD